MTQVHAVSVDMLESQNQDSITPILLSTTSSTSEVNIPQPLHDLPPRNLLTARDDPPTNCPTCASLSCAKGTSCVQTPPVNFNECPTFRCAAAGNIVTLMPPKPTKKVDVGPIIGGVIGGFALIAIATFFLWKFCVKPKRQDSASDMLADETASPENAAMVEHEKEIGRQPRERSSTSHSIASTVLTRASNVIQIAYIPGVTNRTDPSSPAVLVPPVPPIPLAYSSSPMHTPTSYDEPHFFVPGDLRDSTYSGYSRFTDPMSAARSSYGTRASMAPSISPSLASAIISPPPITGVRAKPALVSLKSAGSTPPVPSIDYEKYGLTSHPQDNTRPPPPPSPVPSDLTAASTVLNNARAAAPARPQIVRVVGGNMSAKVSPLNVRKQASIANATSSLSVSTATGAATATSGSNNGSSTSSATLVSADQGPFSDPQPGSEEPDDSSNIRMSTAISEATRKAVSPLAPNVRQKSPFSDDNAVKE